ncbi:HigA family addiction module antitoxin [Entomobacter blattae]|uniref:HTH cro/C1-type domain-containing protein n=1 Tax=Entomobacter blattae TaxID=2762277 RepID=A0A7H1NTZ3_9PROT|nr:HigA family addiction module antitoxin [Entomobacter blattae]QNT79253.1 hypothetical protein JGUZn3_20480 [Entomobacter blattae]
MNSLLYDVTPGVLLKEEFMQPYNLSANALAEALSVPTNRITSILSNRRSITADTAIRLSIFFKTTPEFWLNLQKIYDLRTERLQHEKAIRNQITPLQTILEKRSIVKQSV